MATTYAVVLVGSDCGKNGLTEYECLVDLAVELRYGRVGQILLAVLAAPQHQVDPGLVLVHGVEHDLGASWATGRLVVELELAIYALNKHFV